MTMQLAMDLAAEAHPGRAIGALLAPLLLIGGAVTLVIRAIKAPRRPKTPNYPPPPGYWQPPMPPDTAWTPQHYPAPGGAPWTHPNGPAAPPSWSPPAPPARPGYPAQPYPYPTYPPAQ